MTDRAVDFVKRRRERPFYLSLHYTAPHWPWEGPGDAALGGTLKNGPVGYSAGGSLRTYAEMMKSLDQGVGRVLSTLEATGQERNTLVIFTSDNGGERFSFNWPFTGQKFDLREGGVRVPGIVKWPGVTRPGTVSDQPVITMDWTATMIAAAGANPDPKFPLDGEDIRPVLAGERPKFDRTFFWRTLRQGAARSGKWKYLREGTSETLHELSVDEREQANFAEANPETLAKLREGFEAWESRMIPYPTA